MVTSQFMTAEFSIERVLAERTSILETLSAAATKDKSPGRSGETISIERTSWCGVMTTESSPLAALAICSLVNSGCAAGSIPCIAERQRLTKSSTRVAFQSVQAARPVASPSAMLNACKSSRS